jgi:hypothetical protein
MPQPAVLHVVGGNDRGKLFELTLAEMRIGRGTDQDIVLADIAVSRRHVTIQLENGRYRLRDLGSGNGTLLNGERVESVLLSDGDQIEIGNTLMRFDHPPSRGMGKGGSTPKPTLAAPFGQAEESGFPSGPNIPSLAAPVQQAQPSVPSYRSPPTLMPLRPGMLSLLATLESRAVRWALIGGMTFLVIVCMIIVVSKLAFAKPALAPSDAEEHYRQGLKLFFAKDYEGAKMDFTEALRLAPDSTEARHYAAACDLEVQARAAMQTAERALSAHRYGEAVRALDTVESESLLQAQAVKLRKETAPKAVAEDLDEARRLQAEDIDTARARVTQALELDPGNEEARALAATLKMAVAAPEGAPAPSPTTAKAPTPPRKEGVKRPRPSGKPATTARKPKAK